MSARPRARTALSRSSRVVLACVLGLAVLVPVLSSAHRHTDAWAPRSLVTQEIQYLPTGRALKAGSLGYEVLLADILWARTTLFFGKHYSVAPSDDWYPWVFHMIDLATDLDPEFRAAYKYGGTMLRVDGTFVDQSSLVFQKGMRGLPEEWYFPFGIAMNYFMFGEDRETAAGYMEIAASMDDGPFYLRNLAATLRSDSGDLEAALRFLETDLENIPAQQQAARDAVKVKIFETRYLIARRDAGRVAVEYRRRTGALPTQPEDVASEGLQLPVDPLGGRWLWDDDSEVEIGTMISSRYCEVFVELASSHGLGRLSIFGCSQDTPR